MTKLSRQIDLIELLHSFFSSFSLSLHHSVDYHLRKLRACTSSPFPAPFDNVSFHLCFTLLFVLFTYIVFSFFPSFKNSRKEKKKSQEERESNCRRLADWETIIEHRRFFSLVLVVDWRKINDREKEKMREIRDTHTQQEDNCTRRK